MNVVARISALQLATSAEINGYLRHASHRFPVQHKMLAQPPRYFCVWIKHGAKEPAVGAAILIVKVAEQTQRENRLAAFSRRSFRFLKIRVPVESRGETIVLPPDGIERGGNPVPV